MTPRDIGWTIRPTAGKQLQCARNTHKETRMKASGIQRKLDALAKLEERLRLTENPSAVLLARIQAERTELLQPSLPFEEQPNAETQTRKQSTKRR